jgi:hypothetical protein
MPTTTRSSAAAASGSSSNAAAAAAARLPPLLYALHAAGALATLVMFAAGVAGFVVITGWLFY